MRQITKTDARMTRKCGNLAIPNHFQVQMWRVLSVIRSLRLIQDDKISKVKEKYKKCNVAVVIQGYRQ